MSILVLGAGKTGTTGLYHSIKGALDPDEGFYLLFEPTRAEPFRALARYAPDRPILTKVMIHRAASCQLDEVAFTHRILVVRDPRDVMVSRLLFRPLIRRAVRDAAVVDLQRFLGALRDKEADPASWSLRALHELADGLGLGSSSFGSFVATLDDTVHADQRGVYFTSRYEEFVDGKLGDLSAYLGRDVVNREAGRDSWLSHITRSKGWGDWRHWFTADDVAFFRPRFERYMDHFGYTDWSLASDPAIDPATSSGFIARKLEERRPQVEARYVTKWSVASVCDAREVESLTEMAEDGDAVSAQRLALLYRAGRVVDADPAAAVRWARHGAIQGHTPSMRLLADLVGEGAAGDPDPDGASRWRADASALAAAATPQAPRPPRRGSNRRLRAANRRIRQLEQELAAVKGSVRYGVGSALVAAAANPRRDLPALPRRLWALYRSARRG